MRVPLSWLKEFTPLSVDANDHEGVKRLGRVFSSLGLVVEGIEYIGAGLGDVVLARVVEIRAIKGADRIREVIVDAGGKEPLGVVCGAWNFHIGDIVPLAPVGTELPGGMVITQRKMRGVTSNGMLCSASELRISDDAEGILIVFSTPSPDAALPRDVVLGAPLREYLGISPDVVFDFAIEPNRPDCLCVYGIARDVAARLKLPLASIAPEVLGEEPGAEDLASVEIEKGAPCRGVVARVLRGVTSVPSPPDVARRLVLAGMRPINAIVDASNYVMLELGQPTHPYDLDRLGGSGIRVRLARPGETLRTLDGIERVLGRAKDALGALVDVEDCLICDANDEAVGIAGVMGGASSEIDEQTTNVFLEVADFDPLAVGRTAARQALRTEASIRFWRGIDGDGLIRAADRFCELVVRAAREAKVKEPTVASGHIDNHVVRPPRATISLRTKKLNELLGTALSLDDAASILTPIGFVVEKTGGDLGVTVPSWRPDVSREVDVIEEVARHFGYENIDARERRSPFVGRLTSEQHERRALRRILSGLFAHEALTSSIVDPEFERAAGSNHGSVSLVNPIVPKESVMRTHLLPGLLGALRHNAGHRNGFLRLFEIGHVFMPPVTNDAAPSEHEHVAVALALEDDDASQAVRCLRAICEGLGIDEGLFDWQRPSESAPDVLSSPIALGCHPTRTALLASKVDGATIGVVGEVDPAVVSSFELGSRRIGWLCVDLHELLAQPRKSELARGVSRYPSSDIDLAFVLEDAVPALRLERALRNAAGDLCESIELIDVYRGPTLPPHTRSLAYRLRFCALDRTLTDAEVAAAREDCIVAAEHAVSARLRA